MLDTKEARKRTESSLITMEDTCRMVRIIIQTLQFT